MARSLNKFMVIGNLGADPEVRTTTGGKKVAQFNVATSRQWNNAQGQQQEKTEWHRMILWEGLANVAERFLKKGDRCYFEGEIEYRSYEDKDKITRYVTELRVREMIMLSGPREGQQFGERSGGGGGGRGNGGGGGGGRPQNQGGNQGRPSGGRSDAHGDFQEPAVPPFPDDDLPF